MLTDDQLGKTVGNLAGGLVLLGILLGGVAVLLTGLAAVVIAFKFLVAQL